MATFGSHLDPLLPRRDPDPLPSSPGGTLPSVWSGSAWESHDESPGHVKLEDNPLPNLGRVQQAVVSRINKKPLPPPPHTPHTHTHPNQNWSLKNGFIMSNILLIAAL